MDDTPPGPITSLEAMQALIDGSPFCRFLGLRVLEMDGQAGRFVAEMRCREELARKPGTGQLHGGAISAFADSVGDYALAAIVGGAVPTIDLRLDYLRPVTTPRIVGTGIVRKKGRTLGVVDVEVHDDAGRLAAVARGTYSAVVG
jgi:uncharacterized protein (TIGR00369 family)